MFPGEPKIHSVLRMGGKKRSQSLNLLYHCMKDHHVLQANCLFSGFVSLSEVLFFSQLSLCNPKHLLPLTRMNLTHTVSCWSHFCQTVSFPSMLNYAPALLHWHTTAYAEMQKSQNSITVSFTALWTNSGREQVNLKLAFKQKLHLFHTLRDMP